MTCTLRVRHSTTSEDNRLRKTSWRVVDQKDKEQRGKVRLEKMRQNGSGLKKKKRFTILIHRQVHTAVIGGWKAAC